MSSIAGDVQPGFFNMPKLPVAGFFFRLIAFLIDFFLVLSALHLLQSTFPGFFWALGKWSPYVTGTLTFAYFVLFNSSVGKGRTVGKLLVGISCTDYDGSAPSIRQSFIRTSILLPIFITSPMVEAFFGQTDSLSEFFWKSALTALPLFSILIATFISVPFNPFKQGLHDYFAQTLVRPVPKGESPAPFPSFEEMAAHVGHNWPKFHRQPQYSGGVAFGIVYVLMLFMFRPSGYPEYYKTMFEGTQALRQTPGLEDAEISRVFMASTAPGWDMLLAEFESEPQIYQPLAATSGTLTLFLRINRDTPWQEGLDGTASLFMQRYREEMLPRFIKNVETLSGNPNAGNLDYERVLVEKLSDESFNLAVLFTSYIALTPYPNPLSKNVGIFVEKFPPIENPPDFENN